ncbi:MAG: hypothetical protein GX768_11495 [Chloroflexi bacterium]|nr:hypothetical protein [Chloroflexota bacterium]
MSKQMHQLDDQEDPGSKGFWNRTRNADEQPAQSGFTLKPEAQSGASRIQGPSGLEEHGKRKQNPFENWRI